jgi:hypothetical protein
MSALQRNSLRKLYRKNCENCEASFEAATARYCSKECRTARDKGGKTYDEKRLEIISRCNARWLKEGQKKRVQLDPKYYNMTTY